MNTFDDCQFVPPSIEYSKLEPVAVTVIVPSLVEQPVGLAEATFVMLVGVGALIVTIG